MVADRKGESGEVMIESILVMIPTLFVLIFLLSLGFLLYQRWNVQFVADSVASKVAETYKYIDTDEPESLITLDQIQNIGLYRYLFYADDYVSANQAKAENYGLRLLKSTGYGIVVGVEEVEMGETVEDSLGRRHICVTVEGTYRIPFAEGLEIFGMEGTRTYKAVSYAECIDIGDYVSTVTYVKQAPTMLTSGSKILKMINSWFSVFQNIVKED